MALASAVAIAGIGTLLAVEFFLTTLIVLLFLPEIPAFGVMIFSLILAAAIGWLLWLAIATGYRILLPVPLLVGRFSHDGMADAIELVARGATQPPTPSEVRRSITPQFAVIIAVALVALLAPELIERIPVITAESIAVLAGLAFVCYHTGTVVYEEWTAGGTVQNDLETTARIPDGERSNGGSIDRDGSIDSDTLQVRMDRLASQANVASPTVRVGRARRPIAAAVGYRPETSTVIVSDGLCETLSDREVDAVLAHELAHVANRDAAVLTALSLPAAKFETMMSEPDADESADEPVFYPPFAIAIAVPVAICTRVAVAVVARYREYVADRAAVSITGDPAALASALESLDTDGGRLPASDLRAHRGTAAFSIVPPPWEEHRFFDRTRRFVWRGVFGTHPPTANRIDRLRSAIAGDE